MESSLIRHGYALSLKVLLRPKLYLSTHRKLATEKGPQTLSSYGPSVLSGCSIHTEVIFIPELVGPSFLWRLERKKHSLAYFLTLEIGNMITACISEADIAIQLLKLKNIV